MAKYDVKKIMAGLGKVSTEDNDLNVTINAEHEGDKTEGEEATGFEPEAVETEETPAEPVEPVAEDTSSTPEAAELDVSDASEGVEDTAEKVEDINETAEGLEGIVLTLGRIATEGLEVSPLTAQLLNDHYNFVTRKFPGLRTESRRIASCEAWAADPVDATVVSFEKATESLANAGKAIKKFLVELWQRIVAFIKGIFNAAGAMKAKAKSLAAASHYNPPEKEINVPGILEKGDAADITKLISLIEYLTEARTLKALNEAISAKKVTPENVSQWTNIDMGSKFPFNAPMAGGFKLVSGEDNAISVVNVEGKESSIKPYTAEAAKAQAGLVIKLATAIENYKKGEAERKRLNTQLMGIVGAETLSDDPGRIELWKACRRVSRWWGKQCAFEQKVISKAIAVGNAMNNVIAASIGKEGSAKKEAKK